MTIKYKKVDCPFCDGQGARKGFKETGECPACDGGKSLFVGDDGNIYAKMGSKAKGTWGGQYANLNDQGIPDAV